MNARVPVVIGLDGGTGGARAMVSDLEGRILGVAARSYETVFPRPGWAEQAPAAWWLAGCEAVREAVSVAGVRPEDVLAISANGTSSTVVALDAKGVPVCPAILWMDNRASAEAQAMTATGDDALRRCRAGVSSEWMIAKLLWLKTHRPQLFDTSRWFLEMADYLAYRMSGRLTLGQNQITNRWFYDASRGGWPSAFFERIGLPGITERFPDEVLALGSPIGPICAQAAEAMGLGRHTLVVCGGTDAYVAMVGLDVCRSGETAFITGTSHLVLCMTSHDGEVPGLFGPHPDCVVRGLNVLEGGQVSSGAIIKWWRDHFGKALVGAQDTYTAMMQAAAAIPIGAEGLVALDSFQGNRNPYTDYDLQGAIWGLTLKHTPDHMLRAFLESIAFGTENILRVIESHGVPVTSLSACGGSVRSPFLLQMHADVSGLPIRVPQVTEATAFGSAIVASVGSGAYADLPQAAGQMVRDDFTIEPNRTVRDEYAAVFDAYRATHVALEPLMHDMARKRVVLA